MVLLRLFIEGFFDLFVGCGFGDAQHFVGVEGEGKSDEEQEKEESFDGVHVRRVNIIKGNYMN